MEIVLLERVEKLGQMGDVVTVKDGYARNYLLPTHKALRATKANLARFEEERAQLEAKNLQQRSEAESVADKAAGLSVVLLRQASDSAQLYGSVSSRDIAEAVTEAGVTVDRKQVQLNRAIKELGIHSVDIALHPEVVVTVDVNVARSTEEAEIQANARNGIMPAAEGAEDEEEAVAVEEFFEDASLAPTEEDLAAAQADETSAEAPEATEPPADDEDSKSA
jgi:large subunit ribosomal protein L9